MDSTREPEILPRQPDDIVRGGATDEALDQLASLLDDIFQIPGTRIRFGLDALIGLLPGLGDVITGLLSMFIVTVAWQRGVPRVTVARMIGNIAIDTLLGSLPIAGDAFDVAWKSNRRNVRLLQRSEAVGHRQTWRDWLFLIGVLLAIAAIVAVPILALVWLIRKM